MATLRLMGSVSKAFGPARRNSAGIGVAGQTGE